MKTSSTFLLIFYFGKPAYRERIAPLYIYIYFIMILHLFLNGYKYGSFCDCTDSPHAMQQQKDKLQKPFENSDIYIYIYE